MTDEVQKAADSYCQSACTCYPFNIGERLLMEKGFLAGAAWQREQLAPRNMVSIHGTDGCLNCETGRITIYAASRRCLDCLRTLEFRKDNGGK